MQQKGRYQNLGLLINGESLLGDETFFGRHVIWDNPLK